MPGSTLRRRGPSGIFPRCAAARGIPPAPGAAGGAAAKPFPRDRGERKGPAVDGQQRLSRDPDGGLVARRRVAVVAIARLPVGQVVEWGVAGLPHRGRVGARRDETLNRPRRRLGVGGARAREREAAAALLRAAQVCGASPGRSTPFPARGQPLNGGAGAVGIAAGVWLEAPAAGSLRILLPSPSLVT